MALGTCSSSGELTCSSSGELSKFCGEEPLATGCHGMQGMGGMRGMRGMRGTGGITDHPRDSSVRRTPPLSLARSA